MDIRAALLCVNGLIGGIDILPTQLPCNVFPSGAESKPTPENTAMTSTTLNTSADICRLPDKQLTSILGMK